MVIRGFIFLENESHNHDIPHLEALAFEMLAEIIIESAAQSHIHTVDRGLD